MTAGDVSGNAGGEDSIYHILQSRVKSIPLMARYECCTSYNTFYDYHATVWKQHNISTNTTQMNIMGSTQQELSCNFFLIFSVAKRFIESIPHTVSCDYFI